LRLEVNQAKSAVCSAFQRKFLDYSFRAAAGGKIKRRAATKAIAMFKQRVREQTRCSRGHSLGKVVKQLRVYVSGWKAYFRLADTPGVWSDLDPWIRHRVRAIQLRQWTLATTTYRELRKRGASSDLAAQVAANTRRWWRNCGLLLRKLLNLRLADELGIPRLC
jgi:hypothetical protein